MKKLWLGEFTKSKLDKEINNLYLIEYWIFYKYNNKKNIACMDERKNLADPINCKNLNHAWYWN